MMGNYHARCGAGEKPEVETPEAYLSLFGQIPKFEKLETWGISASTAIFSLPFQLVPVFSAWYSA